MTSPPRTDRPDPAARFRSLAERLAALSTDDHDPDVPSFVHACLCDLDRLDYPGFFAVADHHERLSLLVERLCAVVQPAAEVLLLRAFCRFLARLLRDRRPRLPDRTLACCHRWILGMLRTAPPVARTRALLLVAFKSLSAHARIVDADRCLRLLLEDPGFLGSSSEPCERPPGSSELRYRAVDCVRAILFHGCGTGLSPAPDLLRNVKHVVLDVVSSCCCCCCCCCCYCCSSSSSSSSDREHREDRLYRTRTLRSCLSVLTILTARRLLPCSVDYVGEILGVVRTFLFYGVRDRCPIAKPAPLRPAVMNLPEPVRPLPRCKNFKDRKARSSRQPARNVAASGETDAAPTSEGRVVVLDADSCSDSSDTSDAEFADDSLLLRIDSTVRLETVCLFRALVERSPSRDLFGFWPQIVATGSPRDHARVLARSVLTEPVSGIKRRALTVLGELLTAARPFLMHAEDVDRRPSASFVAFFGTVSLMIKELHFTLSLVLSCETNVAVLTHGLKAAAALIRATPYARLSPGLARRLLRNCRPYVFHRDPTVRVAALSAFEAIASCDPVTPEIFRILANDSVADLPPDSQFLPGLSNPIGDRDATTTTTTNTTDEREREVDAEDVRDDDDDYHRLEEPVGNEYDETSSRGTNLSFLVRRCLDNVSDETMNTPVRLQSLRLIGRLAFGGAGSLILSRLPLILPVLIRVIDDDADDEDRHCHRDDSETPVALHVCRTLEILAGCFSTTVDENDRCSSDRSTAENDDRAFVFWNAVLDPVARLARHPRTVVREAACDCLGSVHSTVFARLPRQKAVLIITVLFGAVRDTESAVRAAGLRSLGMLVALPALREETGFLMDLADVVCSTAADDANLGVRVKAAWALANLCDRLRGLVERNCRSRDREGTEPTIPLGTLLPRMYRVCVQGSKDNDKVKCNAVRALGSVLCLSVVSDAEPRVLKDASSGFEALVDSATVGNDMKVRWNACRALGLILSDRPDDVLPSSWRVRSDPEKHARARFVFSLRRARVCLIRDSLSQDRALPALCDLICDSPNFKVRTNAAWALYSCHSYGRYPIHRLWKSLVLAFENTRHVPSYVEYPHRDALLRQLCVTLGHVAGCTEVSDLRNVWAEIGDHVDDVSGYVRQFQETVVPEKMGDVIGARARLESCARDAPSVEERRIARSLSRIFERNERHDDLDSTVV
ncbi:HEAT repeat-containing protein 6 isoform X3 [Ceratina calcarata]|uniref:HEAT repeat-containing protein 6 n=1 Tax=Ceratina calcarata TaxID=156304 RepID=A0AAJ7SCI3_9HYME|nr:HEAT repeat-containing protein 6 isoform X3 [Ceratina calcarata]